MAVDLKLIKLDDLEYELSLTSTFKSSNLSHKSLVDCLIQSFDLFYNFIVNYKNNPSSHHLFELKERVFSIYIKQVVFKLQQDCENNIAKEASIHPTSGEEETKKHLLNLLAEHPKFFPKLAGSLNFMVLDVTNFNYSI